MARDMIAMLDGLGAYGENPIGTVDPRLLPSFSTAAPDAESWRTKGVVSNPPKPYVLNGEDTIDRGGMGLMPKLLIGGGAALVLYGLLKKKSPPPMNGYPAPEMVELGGNKRRRRRKKK